MGWSYVLVLCSRSIFHAFCFCLNYFDSAPVTKHQCTRLIETLEGHYIHSIIMLPMLPYGLSSLLCWKPAGKPAGGFPGQKAGNPPL